jgi:hypothetical protein
MFVRALLVFALVCNPARADVGDFLFGGFGERSAEKIGDKIVEAARTLDPLLLNKLWKEGNDLRTKLARLEAAMKTARTTPGHLNLTTDSVTIGYS